MMPEHLTEYDVMLQVAADTDDYSTRGCAEKMARRILDQIAAFDDQHVALRAAIAFRFADRVLWEELSRS